MSVVSPTVTVTVYPVPLPTLTLTVDKASGYAGDTFNFTGEFFQNDTPVQGESVTLYRNGVVVGSAITIFDGSYSIPWVADIEGTLNFHTEAAIPPRPPVLSRTIGVGIGVEVPVNVVVPLLAALGIGLGVIILAKA